MVVTGGSLIHSPRVKEIAAAGFFNERDPLSLRPKAPRVLTDRRYILAAMGFWRPRNPSPPYG